MSSPQIILADAAAELPSASATSAPAENAAPLLITTADTEKTEEDRFHRFRLISWWDQAKLSGAKVLVVGAGALGNEIIKNLTLLGVGNLFIADLDRVENSNLSRSILYREADNGIYKADAAARAAREIYPKVNAHPFNGNVVYDLGLGVFRWADVVIGGLDNREARLAINRNCWKVNRPWIDGAIEQIQGTARVFAPDGPCYECTMSETDWKLLRNRRSCNLLSRPEMERGKTPTTPTISSIIAGVQCQEAVKLIHGLETIAGKGWVFNGFSTEAYTVQFQRKESCYSHETLEEIIPLPMRASTATAGELLALARHHLGESAELELARDVLEKLVCPRCHREEVLFASLGRVPAEKAICPHCPDGRRDVVTFYKIRGNEKFLDRTLAEIGVPPFDILTARTRDRAIGFELAGDAAEVLGPAINAGRQVSQIEAKLADAEGLEWE
ncbi:MAG TPA: ThiF family adenylyltransferase [Tepidisphaeraceae bacterium]|jgi:adenylyltransferase/sulfurtransferase|nr:ThiF family adenylyltransferase [Tepidisphaeraceae bacterium]